jgi:lipopolysaccharide transport system ATP-binding protein
MPADADLAIAVHEVSKVYQIYDRPQHRLWESLLLGRRRFAHPFHALQPLSFEVRRGETVGIIGRNGSGKSTLLQIICGTLTPTTGRVRTQGRVAALLELGSGFNPEFTGRDNVHFNAALLGLSPREIEARFDRIAAFADIGAFIDRPVKTYSSGMVVRLAFAVAANVDADILVIDEALAVGDAFFVQKCMRWLRGFMQRGTLLFVSHDAGSIVNLCDRALWLHNGVLMLDAHARLVAETYLQSLAEEAYGGSAATGAATGTATGAATDPAQQTRVERAAHMPPARLPATSSTPVGRLELQWIDLDSRSFGKGGARIEEVSLLDTHDRVIHSIRGGELVTLRVCCAAQGDLRSPIIGFIVKDRLGQLLFGENTFERYKHRPLPVPAGGRIETRFTFAVPILASGDYAIDVAIADGTQLDHVQHHWIHEAVVFRSITHHVATGLVGLPMHEVSMAHVS